MARVTALQAVELKIEKAQEQVSKTKKAYDTAIANLSELLDKRDNLRREELVHQADGLYSTGRLVDSEYPQCRRCA